MKIIIAHFSIRSVGMKGAYYTTKTFSWLFSATSIETSSYRSNWPIGLFMTTLFHYSLQSGMEWLQFQRLRPEMLCSLMGITSWPFVAIEHESRYGRSQHCFGRNEDWHSDQMEVWAGDSRLNSNATPKSSISMVPIFLPVVDVCTIQTESHPSQLL